MLGTGARYAEYGITGGFFLLSQTLLLGLAFPDLLVGSVDNFIVLLSASISKIPQLVQPAIQSLFIALALLSVFIIGLVLEMIGSVFMLQEASLFRKRLAKNQWLERFLEAELPDYVDDYRRFMDLADLWSRWKKMFTSFREYFRGFAWQRQVQQSFRRLELALLAKVMTSGAKTEMLAEQISISRMSRAVGTAMYVVGFEIIMIPTQSPEVLLQPGIKFVVLYFMLPLVVIACGQLITVGAYSRFANLLLSLVYAGWKPQAGHKEVSG